MLKIAVCDDEPKFAQQLADMVMQYAPDCELTCYEHGEKLLESQKTFDLIFLDIQMKPFSGLETAKRIRSWDEGVFIVFITAWKEYVFDAFDVGAFHYLLKPVQPEKLREILQRAQREIQRKNHAKKQQLFLKTREKSFVLNTEDILFLENALRKVVIHMEKHQSDFDYEKAVGEDSAKQVSEKIWEKHLEEKQQLRQYRNDMRMEEWVSGQTEQKYFLTGQKNQFVNLKA